MIIDEILKRLDLKLGMKIIDTKPNDRIKNNNHIYTLVKKHHEIIVFKNSNGCFSKYYMC